MGVMVSSPAPRATRTTFLEACCAATAFSSNTYTRGEVLAESPQSHNDYEDQKKQRSVSENQSLPSRTAAANVTVQEQSSVVTFQASAEAEKSLTVCRLRAPSAARSDAKEAGASRRCEICSKSLGSVDYAKRHSYIHTGNWPFLCDRCGRGCDSSSNLKKHLLTHGVVKPFRCQHCKKGLKMKAYLDYHEKNKVCRSRAPSAARSDAKVAGAAVRCSICSRTFADPRAAKRHSYIHTGKWPFLCDRCGRGCYSLGNLRIHLRIHTDVNAFTCKYCKKRYKTSRTLRAHLDRQVCRSKILKDGVSRKFDSHSFLTSIQPEHKGEVEHEQSGLSSEAKEPSAARSSPVPSKAFAVSVIRWAPKQNNVSLAQSVTLSSQTEDH